MNNNNYSQSVFGGLGKKKKKRKSKEKSNYKRHLEDDEDHKFPAVPAPQDGSEQVDIPPGEISFVLPRGSSQGSGDKPVPFLFPRQRQQLAKKGFSADDVAKEESTKHKSIRSRKEHSNESIDDILFPDKKRKDKEKKSKSTVIVGNDSRKKSSKQEISEETKSSSIVSDDADARLSYSGNAGEGASKKTPASNERSISSERMLARSVEDAIKDKAGRRPRANSTDGELNLPQRGLCDERIVLQSHTWNIKRFYSTENSGAVSTPQPRGFVNLGNTCFLNATLQCLIYMPSFCQSITALPSSCYDTNGSSKKLHGQRITVGLRSLARMAHGIASMEKNEPPRTKPIAPKTLHSLITSCKTSGHRFRPGRQEDAHELLVHLLDAMHEGELFAAGINPHASGWRDRLPIPRLDETTFVHRIFGGYFRSQLLCNKCGYKSNTYDPFLDLALEVSKKSLDSLSSAFNEFSRKETLDANNRWKCSGCRKMVCPTKHLSVFRPPLSLCIQLKRFVFGGCGGFSKRGGFGYGHRHGKGLSMMGGGGSKITKKINFPAHLSLPLSDGRKCDYVLTGVIVHVGNSATSGHYTAYVKKPGCSNQWYHMDDSFVEVVPEAAVLKQRDAYVLFYSREEVKLEFPQPPPRESSIKNGAKTKTPKSEYKLSPDSHHTCSSKKSKDIDSMKNSNGQNQLCKQAEKSSSVTPISFESKSTSSSSPLISDSSAIKHAHDANSKSGSDSSSSDSESRPREEPKHLSMFGGIKRSLSFSNAHKNSSSEEKSVLSSPLESAASPTAFSVSESVSENMNSRKEKKMQGSNVQVVLARKKGKAWKPLEATKVNTCSENNNVLLGNIAIGNWGDAENSVKSDNKKEALRESATMQMDSSDRSRKRKMHLDKWDAMIDEGKRKKVKVKNPENENLLKKVSDSFQYIQRDMQRKNKGHAKGYRPTNDRHGKVSSLKKKKKK